MHQQELRSMCAVMSHRGPHSEGYYQSSYAGLGVRRLGIVDPKGGKQPIHNEDGSVSVVLDGQIYNFKELRQELKGRGHSFSTDTDTEVIAHLYEEYGEQCVEKMRGMFSLALWDERGAKLLLARDRLGIKPLFYTEVADRFIFASELKALLQLPEVNRRFNWHAVSRVFAFLCTPRSESIIQGVGKLAPGHILIASPHQGFHVRTYWQVNFEPDYTRSEDYFIERLRWLLQESITLHARSDVPLGCFLSGGLDSSAVVALMAGLSRNPIKTFSAGFKERDWNELDYARVVARTFGTDHHELILEPDALETIIEALPRYLDEPFGDPSAIPTYMVSKLASEHVTVVLTGDGGDELFAGYEKYPVERRERRYSRLLAPVRPLLGFVSDVMPEGIKGRNFLRHFSLSHWERHLDAVICFKQEQIQRLLQPEILEALPSWDPCRLEREYLATGNRDWLSALLYLDLSGRLSLNDILTKVDRMSMANSLQARPPLLDHKIVEMVATIPPELKLHNGTTKYIFKRAMRGILPDAIVNRPKRGFGVPLGPWFRGPLRNLVREILLSDTTRRRGIFNTEYLEQLVQWHEKGRPLEMQLWTLISFELWCRAFLDR